MRLYHDVFGLTEARLYATAILVWLGAVTAWAGATLLHGRPAHFALGALASAWAGVLALDVLDPDARIVHTNARRAEGRPRVRRGVRDAAERRRGPGARRACACRCSYAAATPARLCAVTHALRAAGHTRRGGARLAHGERRTCTCRARRATAARARWLPHAPGRAAREDDGRLTDGSRAARERLESGRTPAGHPPIARPAPPPPLDRLSTAPPPLSPRSSSPHASLLPHAHTVRTRAPLVQT
jgi:hypothetical protein